MGRWLQPHRGCAPAPNTAQDRFPHPQASPCYLVYEVKDLGEDVGTFPRIDGRFVKHTGLRRSDQGYLPSPWLCPHTAFLAARMRRGQEPALPRLLTKALVPRGGLYPVT